MIREYAGKDEDAGRDGVKEEMGCRKGWVVKRGWGFYNRIRIEERDMDS